MAEISLRAYVKEIDDLIEHEQLDEAIAHCRHVLETYPKHLDTYRLLGKAYLEAKRYGDAADLFQRVLSAIPDDFVAHVGMSIVREDEGNLDASVWHMERAFETNPANPAIQQELRRLVGKRDGLEPHKVRLTRGALARMYAHGELYPQAIAELRSALQEDPDRPDLQVLLANLYWRIDQKDPAAEVSVRTLEKLPFCRDANRLVAASLQAVGKTEEAAPYHRRLAALDPYAAFVESAIVDPASVDPSSIHLQKLEWLPGQPLPSAEAPRRSWTDGLGAGLRAEKAPAQAPQGPLPTWLAPEAAPASAGAPPAPAPAAAVQAPEAPAPAAAPVHPFAGAPPPTADIPPWMRQAGWGESTGAAVEGPVSFSDEELSGAPAPQDNGELAPAEIPDWLKDIAPAQAADEAAETGGMSDWLGEEAAPAPATEAGKAPLREPPTTPTPALEAAPPAKPAKVERAEVPTWLEEPSPGATETIVTWLGDRSARAHAAPPQPPAEPAEEPAPVEEAPAWLSEVGGEFEEETSAAQEAKPEEPPAWLSGVAEAAASEEPAIPSPPSWVTEPPEEEAEPEPELEPAPPAQEAPDWLRAIAVPSSEAAPAAAPEGDWLQGLRAAEPAEPAKPSSKFEAGAPEWMRGIGEGEPEEEPTPEQLEAPDWLRRIGEPAQAREAAPAPEAEEPDWLRGIVGSGSKLGAGVIPGAAGADWMRGIGEPGPKEPAAKKEPLGEPEWLGPIATPAAGTGPAASGGADEDWLRGLTEFAATEEPQAGAPAEPGEEAWGREGLPPETPDWLDRLAATEPGAAAEAPALPESPLEAATTEPESAGELQQPEWLGELASAAPTPGALPQEAVPEDWLKGLLDETQLSGEVEAPQGSAGPDWFSAEPSDIEEPRLEAEDGAEGAPEGWLREAAERPSQLAPAEAPEWLKEFERAGGPPSPSDRTVISRRTLDRAEARESELQGLDASAAAELGEDDVQKWLEALAARQGRPEAVPAPEEILPIEPGMPAIRGVPPAEVPEEGLEWLEQLGEEQAAGQPEPKPAVPAWELAEVEEEAAAPQLSAEPTSEEEEEVPDWLRNLAAEGEIAPVEEVPESAEAEEAPDWLTAAATTTVVARRQLPPIEPPVPPAPEPVEEEGPDWLRAAAGQPEPEPEPAAEVIPTGKEPEGAPDWLLTAASEAEEVVEEAEPVYEEEPTGTVPEWLLKAAEAEPEVPVAPSFEYEPTVPPAKEPTPAPEPVWLRPSEPVPPSAAPESEIVVPEWLRPPVEAPRPAVSTRPPEPVPQPPPAQPEILVEPAAQATPEPAPVAPRPSPAAPPVQPVVPTAPPPEPVPAPPVLQPIPAVTAKVQPVTPPPGEVQPVPVTVARGEPAAEPEPPSPAPKPRLFGKAPQDLLAAARHAIATNDLPTAVKNYSALIRRKALLQDVVADLQAAVRNTPRATLWQTLGDAYMKADLAAEAVEAYRQGLASL